MPATACTPSAAAVNARSRLPFPDHILLWAMRAWVIGTHRRSDTAAHIRTALGMAGAYDAAPPLDRFMRALCLGATRQIRIDCICVPTVSDDERLLLDVIAHHQAGRALDGIILLHTLMDPDRAEIASREARHLAALLLQAGHRLVMPEPGSRPPASPVAAPAVPGSMMVH